MKPFAQALPDGTVTTSEFIELLINNLEEERLLDVKDARANIGLNVYLMVNAVSRSEITQDIVAELLEEVNGYFTDAGFSFYLNKMMFIDNYHYRDIASLDEIDEVVTLYYEEPLINIYITESLVYDGKAVAGFSSYPGSEEKDIVFLDVDYLTGSGLSRQLGHFFGLLSTHETMAGYEPAVGVNCDSLGDLICDTYASPNLLGLVDDDCLYVGSKTDPNGVYYVPSVANIMSEAPARCRCVFSQDQVRRMIYYYLNYRNYLR